MTDSNFTVTPQESDEWDPITGQTTTTAGDGSTFTVPNVPDPRIDHVLEHLHQINDKIDHHGK